MCIIIDLLYIEQVYNLITYYRSVTNSKINQMKSIKSVNNITTPK